ncbi:MAG: TusE/DsrC/DsvC family sulfur relay protein [Acidobacteriota bacterium]
MIDRYLSGEELRQPGESARSGRYLGAGPVRHNPAGAGRAERLVVPHLSASERRAGVALRVATAAPSVAGSTTAGAPSARSPEGTPLLPCASASLAEVEQVVTEGVARREAGRCLRCDLDIYELFPKGPAKGACKVAGLPNADGCL